MSNISYESLIVCSIEAAKVNDPAERENNEPYLAYLQPRAGAPL